jgi:hypothetical protein
VRAGFLGDAAVLQSMLTAGVDERGTPLLQARDKDYRTADCALIFAAQNGHIQAVEMLFSCGRRCGCM